MSTRRIASLLNSCESSNLLDHNNEELRNLISDYFVSDSVAEDWSESEDSDDDEAHETCDSSNVEVDLNETGVDETESNEAIVRVDGAGEINSSGDLAGREANPPALLEAAQFFSCGCKQIKVATTTADDHRTGCVTQFTPDEIVALQLSVKEMDRREKDVLILGFIGACIRNGIMTDCSKRNKQKERQKSRSSYCLMTRLVCVKTFCKLLCIGDQKLKALVRHYHSHNLIPPECKAGGRKNNTAALSLQDTERVVHYIKQYAEDHAVSLPGRVPGFKRDDIRLLPSSCTKSGIYRLYRDSAFQAGYRVVGSSTFRKLWLQLCPFIVVAKPMTDLCWRCQQNNQKIFHNANMTMEEKQELLTEQQRHLSLVDAERQLYRQMVADCKDTVQQHGFVGLQQSQPNSKDITMHYSFDYAQQVHYPSNAAQPGPVYFLTARKCGIFGICCEGLPRQINYLIDEAVNVSKGSNAVISYLHHFFDRFGLGERKVHLHCDNCAGQNKNRFMLWYCAWRVLKGLHSEITLNFMPPGHTKFAPDWCFGSVKRCFRRSEVSCLNDIQQVVSDSTAVSGVNVPQLTGREDGTVLVPVYDWNEYLSPVCKVLKGIKQISHFRFSSNYPGCVLYKTELADAEEELQVLQPEAFRQLQAMPRPLPPPGLPLERRQYLFKQIREFVRDDQRDVVCPDPGH